MDSPKGDRRRKPRVKAGLAARFCEPSGEGSVTARTLNVSTAGVCCRMSTEVAPLTKVKITLVVPDATSRKKAKMAVVETEGVVVRSEPRMDEKGSQEYEIACAFTLLGDEERKVLEAYVDHRLAETPPSGAAPKWQGAEPVTQD